MPNQGGDAHQQQQGAPLPPHRQSELALLLAKHRRDNQCQEQHKTLGATWPRSMPPPSELVVISAFVLGLCSAIASNPTGVLIELNSIFVSPSHAKPVHGVAKALEDLDKTSVVASAALFTYVVVAATLHLAVRGYSGLHNLMRFGITVGYCVWNPAAPHIYSDHQLLVASGIILLMVAAWDTTVILNAITGVKSLRQVVGTETCSFCGCTEVPSESAKDLMTACANDAAARGGRRTATWAQADVDEDSRSFLSTYTFSWLSDVMRFASIAPGYLADRKHAAALPRLPHSSKASGLVGTWKLFVQWRQSRRTFDQGAMEKETAVSFARFFFLHTPQGHRFIYIIPLKIVQDVTATLVGPIAVSHIISYLRATPATTGADGDAYEGAKLLLFVFVALSAQALFFQAYLHHLYRVALDTTTSVRLCIHEAVTNCPAYARSGYGQGDVINMATVDASRMSDAVVFLHNVWGHPLIISVCLAALVYFVGVIPSLAALAALGLLAWVNTKAVDVASAQQKQAAAATSARTSDTTDCLQCIRAVKFIGFEKMIVNRLHSARDNEVAAENRSIFYRACTTLSSELGTALAYAACFIAFYFVDDDFDAARLVPAVAILNSLRFPIWSFPGNAASIMRGAASASRVAAFLSDVADSTTHRLVVATPGVKSGVISAENTPGAAAAPTPFGHPTPLDDDSKSTPSPFSSSPTRSGRKLQLPAHTVGAVVRCSDDALAAPHPGSAFTLPLNVEGVGLQVDAGELLYVTGASGTGKSTLLRALAGEASVAAGEVAIEGASKVAYCPQTPWIFNGTVRENILCGLPLDRPKYQKVLHATALSDDVERWERQDQHDVGNAGAALSGGQKARVAFARACYANADIYLFDDILSAVDEGVQRHIVRHCLLGYLRNATRIFTTTTELTASPAPLLELSRAAFLCVTISAGTGFKVIERHSVAARRSSPILGESALTPHSRASTPSLGSRPKPVPPSLSNPATVQAAKESRQRFGVLWLLLVVVIACGAQTAQTALDASIGAWSSGRNTSGYTLVRALTVLGIVGSILSAIRAFVFYRRSLVASSQLHKSVVQRVIHANLSWLEAPTRIGGITAVLTKDQDVTDHAIPESVDALLASILKLTAVCLFNAVIQPWLLLLMPPMVASFSSVTERYLDGARDMRRLEAVVKNDNVNCLSNALRGGAVARGLGAAPKLQEENMAALDAVNAATNAGNLLARWVGLRLEAVAMLLAFVVACLAVATRGSVNAAFAGIAVSNCLNVTRTMLMLCRRIGMFQAQTSSLEQLIGLNNSIPPSTDPNALQIVTPMTGPTSPAPPAVTLSPSVYPQAMLSAIEFNRVAVRYAGQNYDTVSDVSFRVGLGEHVTLVGRTGAGKSTLVSALLGHATVTAGSVVVMGTTVADACTWRPSGGGLPTKLRHLVGVVPQEPMLLPRMSWRHHLVNTADTEASVPDEWIRAALSTVGLDKVCTPSMSLDAPVEANGVHLSPAQAQLLSFSRVLCMPSVALVILDEVAASVELATEKLMLSALKGLPSRPAILSIAHGGQALVECDRVIDLTASRENDTPMGSFEQFGATPIFSSNSGRE